MSDLRHDPVDDIWVAMAGNRRARPMEFISVGQRRQQMICPFCLGNEAETTAAIVAFDKLGQPLPDNVNAGWWSRVIANKYPSFSIDGQKPLAEELATGFEPDAPPPFRVNDNPGYQELIIPSPRHCVSISELNEQELHVSFLAIQRRLQAIRMDNNVKHAMLFLNCRSDAGASLGHVHWQLIGTPLVSSFLQRRAARELEHAETHGESLTQKLLNWEIQKQTRVIRETDTFCIVCPFASRFPFQIHIVPKDPKLSLLTCAATARSELARHCRNAVRSLEVLLDGVAYNVLLVLPPMERIDADPWYIQIFPRIAKQAGFELGTDIWINPVSPETAARAVRSSMNKP